MKPTQSASQPTRSLFDRLFKFLLQVPDDYEIRKPVDIFPEEPITGREFGTPDEPEVVQSSKALPTGQCRKECPHFGDVDVLDEGEGHSEGDSGLSDVGQSESNKSFAERRIERLYKDASSVEWDPSRQILVIPADYTPARLDQAEGLKKLIDAKRVIVVDGAYGISIVS